MDDIREALKFIDPAKLSYQEWLNIGMAIKSAGFDVSLWDEWSKGDSARYDGKCSQKWGSFKGSGITVNTIFKMAIENGFHGNYRDNSKGRELYDGEVIDLDDNYQFIDFSMIDSVDVPEPTYAEWNQIHDIRAYLSALFSPSDHVAYCVKAFKDKNGKYHPSDRNYDRTAGRLIDELDNAKCIEDVFYDYNHECGAWISFNPMDGNGCKIDNIIDFKYALVESDKQAIDLQYALMLKMELPIAALVHSGNKSLHAIVHIDASNEKEYSRRVDQLFKICKKNGLEVDTSAKNPSRLSRMPGFFRGENRQYLIGTNLGKENWNEWIEYIESINDDLPDPLMLSTQWENMPELAPPLIDGILRQGHKMLLAGPSKAGKSFALIELCIAIAEGKEWLGWKCAQGKIMYINLELDSASCFHRFKDVYKQMDIQPNNLHNISIWNLRGKAVPMDKLAPKLIRRAQKENFIAVVIDPIYKVITGDENSAEQMAKFTNQFDKVATDLKCAVIYCHHHSKGSQSGKKSMDRASGSGVFARDPDAMIDMIELPLNESTIDYQKNIRVCQRMAYEIKQIDASYYASIPFEDFNSRKLMMGHAWKILRRKYDDNTINKICEITEKNVEQISAWRIDLTLREFPKQAETNVWFDYPIHIVDNTGTLENLEPESEMALWQKGKMAQKTPEQRKDKNRLDFEIAYENLKQDDEEVTTQMMAEYMNVSTRTIWRRLQDLAGVYQAEKTKEGIPSVIEKL